jgi:hypothetical protein
MTAPKPPKPPAGRHSELRLTMSLVSLFVAMCLAACSSPPSAPAPTATKTVTVASPPPAASPASSAPAPAPTAGPHSKLADIDLPAGTVPTCCGTDANNENWLVTKPYDYTVQFLRHQLPISHDLKGMPWCREVSADKSYRSTAWSWADDTNSLDIDVDELPPSPGIADSDRVKVSIVRSADFGGPQGLGC